MRGNRSFFCVFMVGLPSFQVQFLHRFFRPLLRIVRIRSSSKNFIENRRFSARSIRTRTDRIRSCGVRWSYWYLIYLLSLHFIYYIKKFIGLKHRLKKFQTLKKPIEKISDLRSRNSIEISFESKINPPFAEEFLTWYKLRPMWI